MSRSQEAIERVRSATDIVDLVGRYIPLKRSGQSFKARCPFHEEKTPSFHVQPARQTFHCFGCGEKGGVFDFIMKIERVEFRDALSLLASQAGIPLDPPSKSDSGGASKAELFRLHEFASRFFSLALRAPEGRECREYLRLRGIDASSVDGFSLGYSPSGWTTLLGRASEKGFSAELLVAGGLASRAASSGRTFDFFRERLMFPIRDGMGRVVGFGARTLGKDEPKYLNTQETPIFAKGRNLYGIDRLKGRSKSDPILVMEGYTDVIMSAQQGVGGCVASLGTALTSEQAKLLSRYSDRVVMLYDGDSAGRNATEKATMELLAQGLVGLQVADLPEGRDPCDHFAAEGAAGLPAILDESEELLDYMLGRALRDREAATIEGRRSVAFKLLGAAVKIPEPVTQDLIISRIADRLAVPVHVLREQLQRLAAADRRGVRVHAGAEKPAAPAIRGAGRARQEVLAAMLNEPDLIPRASELMGGEAGQLLGDRGARLMEALAGLFARGYRQPGLLLDGISDPELREIGLSLLSPESSGVDFGRQLEGAVAWLKNRREREDARALASRLDETPESDVLTALQERYRMLKGRGYNNGAGSP